MTHTPRPWAISTYSELRIVADNGYGVAKVNRDFKARGKEGREAFEHAIGNAELIVRAVNSHDALVSLLETAAMWLKTDEWADKPGSQVNSWLGETAAALRQARGEKG